MKILVISLLRLGDIILHREIARSLKNEHPGCEIHFLIYSQFQSVQPLIPEVQQWHHFDRKEMQKILVEREQSPIAAYEMLETTVETLNSEKFDLVLNATHNRFSVRLIDLLEAREKRGVALENGRKVADRNSWQTYFNENFSEIRGSRFHYLEVLQKSLEVSFQLPAQAQKREPNLILIQLLTSDVKKNWGLHKFRQLKQKLETAFPNDRIIGICSPQENQEVLKTLAWNEFITPTLEEAQQLLKEARLLITGDTSMQHLAAQQGCPVLALFLGSADPVKTSPWQIGAWVVQGSSACSPCAHSAPCNQKSHLCAESLSVETVLTIAEGILKEKEVRIKSNPVFKTESHQGSYRLVLSEEPFERALEQIVWSTYLSGHKALENLSLEVDPETLNATIEKHEQFQISIQTLRTGKISAQNIEDSFPQWKDSILRLKRDTKGWGELDQLTAIRKNILQKLSHSLEATHGRNRRQPSQERFAEA